MPCDTRLKKNQTIQQRATEVKAIAARADELLRQNLVKAVVDRKTGAVAFSGLTDEQRDGATDACIYRRVMATGSALAKAAIARAEQVAGRAVNKQALAHGVHSHDGGHTFHHGH